MNNFKKKIAFLSILYLFSNKNFSLKAKSTMAVEKAKKSSFAEKEMDIEKEEEENKTIEVEKAEELSFVEKENKIKKLSKEEPLAIVRSDITGLGPLEDDFKEKNKNNQTSSQVLNIAPGYNPRTLIFESPNLIVEMDGKIRIEGSYGLNTRLLNSCNGDLDKFFVPGKSTIDLGFGVEYGKQIFERNIVTFGVDLRNRSTWGKPDTIASTTVTSLRDGTYNYGAHKHDIGVPLLYVRGFDLTLDLNSLSGETLCKNPLHYLKLGFFPFEIGRGISLGAAYAITPDFLSYEPGDVIQEFAPGILFEGSFDKNKYYHYRSYVGILKNQMSSFIDVNQKTKSSFYGMKYNPQRGFGVASIIFANQFDWTILDLKKSKFTVSPYLLLAHDGEEKITLLGDSAADLVTLGLSLNGGCNNFSFGFEYAQNLGYQDVYGLDTNSINFENRVYSNLYQINPADDTTFGINSNTATNLLKNSAVLYTSINETTDLNNKNAVYLGESNPRQIAINNVYPSSINNGKQIPYVENNEYILKNSNTRFRDPYTNILNGFMVVADIAYNLNLNNKNVKFALEGGFASGDENPNSPLLKNDCKAKNKVYNGFISVQELYTGKAIRSVFMMSGVGKAPRVLSFPEIGNDGNPLGYPSKINRFSNIAYIGGSSNFFVESCNYTYKINPNAILFWQPVPPIVYNQKIADLIGKDTISSFLGTELNIFLEVLPKKADNLKFYLVGTIFFPGYYYSDLNNLPLDKEQASYINTINSGKDAVFTPLIGNSPAFYINAGLEFKF